MLGQGNLKRLVELATVGEHTAPKHPTAAAKFIQRRKKWLSNKDGLRTGNVHYCPLK